METPCWYQLLETLKQDPNDQECKDCRAPRQFLTSAQYRFCNREIYGPLLNGTIVPPAPLEYTWSPATYRYAFRSPEEAEQQQLVWLNLLSFF